MIKVSINKLAEFLADNNASRRQKIVEEQIKPMAFIVKRYEEAKGAIIEALCQKNSLILANIGKALTTKPTYTGFQENDKACSIEALKAFANMSLPDFTEFQLISNKHNSNQSIKIGKVQVNVNPDILIIGNKNGKKVMGAIKLHLSKSNKLDKEGMSYVSTILYRHLEDLYGNDSTIKIDNSLCISIDVFNKEYHSAPKSYKNKFKAVVAGCKQYELIWTDAVAGSR